VNTIGDERLGFRGDAHPDLRGGEQDVYPDTYPRTPCRSCLSFSWGVFRVFRVIDDLGWIHLGLCQNIARSVLRQMLRPAARARLVYLNIYCVGAKFSQNRKIMLVRSQ
jgi:hypothetical protein